MDNYDDKKLYLNLSELILKSIFKTHKIYNGSMFSEYELIGQINYENKLLASMQIIEHKIKKGPKGMAVLRELFPVIKLGIEKIKGFQMPLPC